MLTLYHPTHNGHHTTTTTLLRKRRVQPTAEHPHPIQTRRALCRSRTVATLPARIDNTQFNTSDGSAPPTIHLLPFTTPKHGTIYVVVSARARGRSRSSHQCATLAAGVTVQRAHSHKCARVKRRKTRAADVEKRELSASVYFE